MLLARRPAKGKVFATVRANDTTAFNPQLWANESLAILEENMVGGMLVHRDFENVIAKYGDTVHTRRPGQFTALRKDLGDPVTLQDATATDVTVLLNQHVHVSFIIRDGEESKAFKDLVQVYLAPAMLAQARFVDRVVLGQHHRFLMAGNIAGGLGQLTGSNGRPYILGTRKTMNQNKAYMDGRNLVITPNAESNLLNLDLFTAAYAVGDQGTALKKAWLGQKLGFDIYMCQNMASVPPSTCPTLPGAINNVSGYAIGTTVLTTDSFTGAVAVGQFFTIAGDFTPYQVKAHTETLGNTTSITIAAPGLRNAVADDAVITVYQSGATVGAGTYVGSTTTNPVAWSKEIVISSLSQVPSVGQLVSFDVQIYPTNSVYTIVNTDGLNGFTLDRPLEQTITTGMSVNLGPVGDYNMAFHRNAIALVVRPLAMPMPGTGALSAVVNHNGLSMRATIQYDGSNQGHRVTLDMLMGIALLDANLGAVMLG